MFLNFSIVESFNIGIKYEKNSSNFSATSSLRKSKLKLNVFKTFLKLSKNYLFLFKLFSSHLLKSSTEYIPKHK